MTNPDHPDVTFGDLLAWGEGHGVPDDAVVQDDYGRDIWSASYESAHRRVYLRGTFEAVTPLRWGQLRGLGAPDGAPVAFRGEQGTPMSWVTDLDFVPDDGPAHAGPNPSGYLLLCHDEA